MKTLNDLIIRFEPLCGVNPCLSEGFETQEKEYVRAAHDIDEVLSITDPDYPGMDIEADKITNIMPHLLRVSETTGEHMVYVHIWHARAGLRIYQFPACLMGSTDFAASARAWRFESNVKRLKKEIKVAQERLDAEYRMRLSEVRQGL